MKYNNYQTQKREELKACISSAQLVLDEANKPKKSKED